MVTTVSQKIRVKFAKTGLLKFISHLDLMRLFQRGLRRAGIPVFITKGFNPHPRISVMPALKLGLESDGLEAVFKLERWMRTEEVKRRLQGGLPEEIKISEVEII
ncbi:MAG: TIGR03936 family radical SAM-associated protein [Candidatus Omnitrophota bacterium]